MSAVCIRALTSTRCFPFHGLTLLRPAFSALNKFSTTCVPEDFSSFLVSIFQPSPLTFALISHYSLQVPQC